MKHLDENLRLRIESQAITARASILTMTTLSASGHPGGSMSSIDILLSLYNVIQHDPKNPYWEGRDRVVVSNGHISPAVYSALGLLGYFDLDTAISQFRKAGSIFEGHIERTVPGVEWTTGNLGQGLSAGAGMALAAKIHKQDYKVYVLMGDGEQQKGQLSEARRFARKFKLGNLIAIVDYNRLQICGSIGEVMPQNIRHNYESDGWKVLEINGHDISQILTALNSVHDDIPTMILAHTTMGKGVDFMENKEQYHGSTLSETQLALALEQLKQPNRIEEFKNMRQAFSYDPLQHNQEQFKLKTNYTQGIPRLYESETDNRSAWGNAVADLADVNKDNSVPIVVLDCDLQGSVKTSEFAKVNPDRFFQCGIMEHNAAVVGGALSSCNIQTFWADFGMFGLAEVYNMQRLNDINHANLKTILTHVGLDVGEDGRTHQSIDYINLARNLFGFRIICPADPNQTDRVIRWLVNQPGNYIVTMGRSKLHLIRNDKEELFYGIDYNYEYGRSDVLRDGNDGTVFVCGTPIGSAIKAIDQLRMEGIYPKLIYISSPLVIEKEIIESAARSSLIISIEDHSIHGGLGTTIAESLAENSLSAKLVKLGVDSYPMSGSSNEIFQMNGLDSTSIIKTIKAHILNVH